MDLSAFDSSAGACREFSCAQAWRRGVAAAGNGLPAIEPGMPEPAGTGLSRRSFLLRAAGLSIAVYGGQALAPRALEEGIATAVAQAPNDPVFVSIYMPGGADGLSLLAPTGDPLYVGLRPTLAVKPDEGTAFSEDDRLRWHPEAAGFATLHAEGKVAVAPAIGYTGANQSHFTSRHYWEVGEVEKFGPVGWLGRYLDRYGAPDNPLQGLTLGDALSPMLAPAAVPVAAIAAPHDFRFQSNGVNSLTDRMLEAWEEMGSPQSGDEAWRRARLGVRSTSELRRRLAAMPQDSPVSDYPTDQQHPFAPRMRALAAMLGAGFPLRCVALIAPGAYDNHANQAAVFPPSLSLLSRTLFAFQRDIEARGIADRVLIHVWSEFGRRPKENGSGTDHGAAGISMVIGTRVNGQMIGEFPGLATLDEDDNVRATSDFRGTYCALLEQWLGADAEAIIPGAAGFARPQLVAA
jgi:uncharacterized protein (DUF1501 family)